MGQYSDIENVLHDWFVVVTGLTGATVLLREPKAARPAKPYARINVTTAGAKLGLVDEKRMTSANNAASVLAGDNPVKVDAIATIRGPRRWVVSFHIFGDTAMDLMLQAQIRLDSEYTRALFRAAGLGLVGTGEVRPIPILMPGSNDYEERAHMDLEFLATAEFIENQSSIDSYVVTGAPLTGTHSVL